MKPSILLTFLSLFFFSLTFDASAQADSVVLSDGDIERLLTSFEPMVQDIQKLGEKYENVESPGDLDTLAAQQEVMAVLEKHGWDEQFKVKIGVMVLGLGIIEMENQLASLPEDQRALMQGLTGFMKMGTIHPNDLNRVKAKYPELKTFFENVSAEE